VYTSAVAADDRTEARNEKLDRLKEALDEWYERERSRYEDEATFLKSVLRGRTGSERLSRENTTEAEVLVTDDITSFLAGT
jgi:hypothetical protein